MSRRRIPPMPIEDLIDNPTRAAMPAAGRGMIDELCMHFWKTECRSFPMDEDTVFGIVRAHRPTWRHHRQDILKIFEEIRPKLEKALHNRTASIGTLRTLRDRRTANERRNKLLADKTQTNVPAQPKHGAQRKARMAIGDRGMQRTPPDDDGALEDGEMFHD